MGFACPTQYNLDNLLCVHAYHTYNATTIYLLTYQNNSIPKAAVKFRFQQDGDGCSKVQNLIKIYIFTEIYVYLQGKLITDNKIIYDEYFNLVIL